MDKLEEIIMRRKHWKVIVVIGDRNGQRVCGIADTVHWVIVRGHNVHSVRVIGLSIKCHYQLDIEDLFIVTTI